MLDINGLISQKKIMKPMNDELSGTKRERRRQRREAEFGPERSIVSTTNGAHTLSCGHVVTVNPTERPRPHPCKHRRCLDCRIKIHICFMRIE